MYPGRASVITQLLKIRVRGDMIGGIGARSLKSLCC